MKKIRLTETELINIIKRVIIEQESSNDNFINNDEGHSNEKHQLEEQIFRYLDERKFIKIKKRGTTHFANNHRDYDSLISYDYNEHDGWCWINLNLIYKICYSLSLKKSDFQQVIEQVIGRWVANTLQMKVTKTAVVHNGNHHLVLRKLWGGDYI